MAFRIHDLNRQQLLSIPPPSSGVQFSHILHVPSKYPTINSALLIAKPDHLIEISSGIYQENLFVKEKIHITGVGEVKILGKVVLEGNGNLSNLEISELENNGNRSLSDCQISKSLIIQGSLYGHNLSILCSTVVKGQAIIRLSSLIPPKGSFALLAQDSDVLLENSSVLGPLSLEGKSVVHCNQVSIADNTNVDLIEVEENSTIQLFNCIASGGGKIKSGNGTSIRSNLVALGSAKELIGGENVIVPSV
jgi:hypothetical protein